ncbi:hypothetical protein GCM10027275_25900 [Rhabdobacter roseus]|uniref:PA14 domain-containing protein n=1 Tax=Rhabdobacter roseus TaxID=1655419 RepID=A0A840TK02_9BACT|nr:family 16 glycoside hydrolase [Rhabdobacter roseus]MBB5284536.1 hypothetical protein [Rhabdobacter roseus]
MQYKAKTTVWCLVCLGMSWLSASFARAQSVSLTDLSAFQKPQQNWRIVGSVTADLTKKDAMTAKAGTGVLANLPAKQKYGMEYDLFTKLTHGDADIELDFMMAKGSNSGIYLQGRYEVQLFDSWGKANPSVHDGGAIYERWNESKPEGEKGFEGTPPRMNVTRAPGLWQHIKISFQAPRFDGTGNKIANAKVLRIELNGVTIHENVELTGPTRGAMVDNEVPLGPLRFQGDHGPVAFRNLVVRSYDKPKPTFVDLKYAFSQSKVSKEEDLPRLKVDREGEAAMISSSFSTVPNDYVLRFTGKIKLAEAGKYRFNGQFVGGNGRLKINNTEVLPWSWWRRSVEVDLPAGELPFELVFSKQEAGARASLGLTIEGTGVRLTPLHDVSSASLSDFSDPILLATASEPIIHRSFINYKGKKVPHGVSVGEPTGISYSVDLENGSLFRVWKGGFLDVTPMWNDRGNGTSMPLGSVMDLSAQSMITAVAGAQAANYRFRGYDLDAANRPTFRYEWNNTLFEDAIRPDGEGTYLTRTIRPVAAQGKPAAFTASLVEGTSIETSAANTYLVDGTYYIRINEGGKATVQNSADGKKALVITTNGNLSYSLIW